MPATAETTDQALNVDTIMTNFEQILIAKEGAGNTNRGPLWYAWHYLQVYSYWGLRQPHTDADLKLTLGISNPAAFGFYGSMRDAYQEINSACSDFISKIFPNVVELGTDLHTFATEASSRDQGIFSAVRDLLNEEPNAERARENEQAAIELLTDLQAKAKQNADKAGAVKLELAAYKTKLVTADEQLKRVQKAIDSDSRTSQATIDKLSGDVNKAGSLAAINKQIADLQKEYTQDVTIAATTPTYAWVVWPLPPIPVGLIAAVTVASVYGSRATDLLKQIERLEKDYKKASEELTTAIGAHNVQRTAKTCVTEASANTDKAIIHTTTVQNAWEGIATQLGVIKDKLLGSTRTNNGQTVLSAKAVIRLYLSQAATAWDRLMPPLTELTTNPYIVVKDKQVSLRDLAKEMVNLNNGAN